MSTETFDRRITIDNKNIDIVINGLSQNKKNPNEQKRNIVDEIDRMGKLLKEAFQRK